jgi:ABC-type uncharacterized transport system permease subunit
MRRGAALLRGYIQRYFQRWTAMRAFVFTLAINQAVTPLIGLAVWTIALPGETISTYYIALLFVRLFTVSYENHIVSNGIYSGEFVDELLLPHAFILKPFSENLAIRLWHLLIGLPLLVVVALLAPVHVSPAQIALAVPALLAAAALQFLFGYALALSAFWTQRAHGITGLGGTLIFLLGGEAGPIYLFPRAARTLAMTLPFHAMYGFPAEIAAGAIGPAEVAAGYAAQALWLGLLATLAALVWRSGIRRYTAIGG